MIEVSGTPTMYFTCSRSGYAARCQAHLLTLASESHVAFAETRLANCFCFTRCDANNKHPRSFCLAADLQCFTASSVDPTLDVFEQRI